MAGSSIPLRGRSAAQVVGARETSRRVWTTWFWWSTAGEVAGFSVPATVGAVSVSWATSLSVPAVIAAGAVEGAALGAVQAHVLRRVRRGLDRRAYILATAVAAALAYAIALTPSALGSAWSTLPLWVVGPLVSAGALTLVASIGTAQWLVLRRVLPQSGSWVVTTAGAWAVGLLAFMAVATPLWQEGQPLTQVIAIGVLAGVVMAAVVAALTGAALVRLLRRAP